MSIQFKDLKITTMTIIAEINGTIGIRSAFHLLPITKISLKQHRESKKCDLPLSPIPGAILSMRYKENGREMVRGIIRNDKKSFKNSITLDISTKFKNLSLKISPNTVQLCGAPSRDVGTEATNYIIEHFKSIKENLEYIRNHMDDFTLCFEWLKDNARGMESDKIIYHQFICKNVIVNVEDTVLDYNIKIVSSPDYLNAKIIKFLYTFAEDMFYHSDYINKISHIPNFTSIYQEDLNIGKINEVMVNYNYNLGFTVNRDKLNELIDGRNGLYSHYDSSLVYCVTVELPYEQILDYTAKKIKKEIPHHTFLIYSSGAVTQSGPCSSTQPGRGSTIMEEAFNIFMKTIDEIKDDIMIKKN